MTPPQLVGAAINYELKFRSGGASRHLDHCGTAIRVGTPQPADRRPQTADRRPQTAGKVVSPIVCSVGLLRFELGTFGPPDPVRGFRTAHLISLTAPNQANTDKPHTPNHSQRHQTTRPVTWACHANHSPAPPTDPKDQNQQSPSPTTHPSATLTVTSHEHSENQTDAALVGATPLERRGSG